MKQIKFLGMLLIALTMCIGITSCEKDEPTVGGNKKIVGTWVQTNDYGTSIEITFKSNSTGYIDYIYESGNSERELFEYEYDPTDDEVFITGDCQLNGMYEVHITANTLTLAGYIGGDYGVFKFTKSK